MSKSVTTSPTQHHTTHTTATPQVRRRENRRRLRRTAIAATSAAILALTACSDGGSSDAPAQDDGNIKIVASTSIWGNITEKLIRTSAPDKASNIEVVTLLSSNAEDPHTYEATARDLAELRSADIVVAGGGGYDNWMTDNVAEGTTLVTALPLAKAHDEDHGEDHSENHSEAHSEKHDETRSNDKVKEHKEGNKGKQKDEHGDSNPHIWFDMTTVDQFAKKVSQAINATNPELNTDPSTVEEETATLRKRIEKLPSMRVVLTESIAEPLVRQSTMKNLTPDSFAQAVAKESEPSAAALAEARETITKGKIDVLISNRQSQAAASTELISTAESEDVPVVNINETPDPGQNYFDYVSAVIDSLESAAK